jgi:hypothetical protein
MIPGAPSNVTIQVQQVMDWVQQVVFTRCSKWGDQVKQVILPGAASNVTI